MIPSGGHATVLFFLAALLMLVWCSIVGGNLINNTTTPHKVEGTRWAVLVAGSNGYDNYRHQADVCNAYQILKRGGLKDENIIVFMSDDIAFDPENPRPGVIINKPNGVDVYAGVPKDYTGHNAIVGNLFGVILGNKSALTGGSGKVVNSGPNDHIFIYYADHGSAGVLGMPYGEEIFAKDLIQVLKKKHEAKTYKSMVLYIEACESGSMFEGLLPNNLSIYAITASNAVESSYAVYCPEFFPPPPPQYDTCLGDLISVSWLEDSDIHDLRKETLRQQYKMVRRRTGFDYTEIGSHVMQYGNLELSKELLSVYMGKNPANDGYSSSSSSMMLMSDEHTSNASSPIPAPKPRLLDQRDASLLHFWQKYHRAPKGSSEKVEAHKKLLAVVSHIRHVDSSITGIATILFGGKGKEKEDNNVSYVLNFVRPSGQPLVEDWDCLKMLVKVYEKQCGSLSWYGRKYTRAFANMCNAGVNGEQMTAAAAKACSLTD